MNDPTPVLQVGIVGLGVGEQHARAFHAHPGCHVRALLDLDAERARKLATEFPGSEVFSRYDEMLADPVLDVIAIASFDDAHYQHVIGALDAGKHVFVEKPLCRSISELAEIKSRWQAAGGRLKLRSNLTLRAAPLFQWLRAHVQSGDLGQVYSFDGDYLYGRLHKITEGWRKDVPDYSVIEGGGVHLVDLLLWLTGDRPVSVTAAGNRISTNGTAFHYNDFVAATFQFASGLVGRVTANFGCVHRHQHVVRVFGTKATFLCDDAGPRLCRSRDPNLPFEPLALAPLASHKGDLIPGFVSAILEDADDRAQTQGFFDDISVCVAADRALATGQRQCIEYV